MPQFENYAPYEVGIDTTEAVNVLFRKVYQFMAMGLILTALAAYLTASSAFMINLLYTSRAPMLMIAVVEIGLVFWLSAGIDKLSPDGARNIFFFMVYSVLNGVLCSSVLLVYIGEGVSRAFLSAAGMFGAMSIYDLYIEHDYGAGQGDEVMRKGLFGLIIAMVVSLFMGSSMAGLCLSILGIRILSGLTAYDTAKIKSIAESYSSDEAMTGKIAVIGALSLYLDFVNLFLYLLRLFGKHRD